METAEELRENINITLETEYWTAPNTPKKCVLHQCYDLVNLYGYVTEIYDRYNEKDLLFIADERQKKGCYGYGFILERSELLARRCLLLEDRAVRIIEKGLWI